MTIMIPRLAPRRTTPSKSEQELLTVGVENDDPMEASRRAAMPKLAATTSGARPASATLSPRPSCSTSSSSIYINHNNKNKSHHSAPRPPLEAPLSPAVTQSPHDAFLLDPSSALTPPVTGPRPLVVSAKRVAHHVRRQNSSKRLRRRTSATATTTMTTPGWLGTSTPTVPHPTDGAAHCLWRDAGAPPRALDSSSDEEGEKESLPCHPNPQGYWDYCYGSTGNVAVHDHLPNEGRVATTTTTTTTIMRSSSWSASRKPPSKGCLSHKKRKSTMHAALQSFLTPPTTPDEDEEHADEGVSPHPKKAIIGHRVQFGSPQAVEFDSEGPAAQLTPLPSEVTRQRYSMMQVEPSRGEADMSAETKRNSALLAEWEDDGPLQATSSAARRRQQRNTRRSSSIFTPSPNSSALLDENDVDMQVSNKLDSERRDGSPATMVLQNLASLCVDSPSSTMMEHPVLTPRSSFSTNSSSSSSTSSSSSSGSPRTAAVSTAELAIPLGDLHTHGAATIPRKVQRMLSPDASNTAGGATPMSLQAIHSMGGALGTMPSINQGRQLSPISRMSQTTATVPPPSTPNLLHDGRARISPSPTVDVIKILLEDPSADQTFEPKDVFLALVREDSNEQNPQKKKRSRLAQIIHAISPQWDGVLSCLEDLKEQVRFCANTRSNTKFRLPASQEAFAKQMVMREWKELEIEFFLELSQALERNTEQAKMLWHAATSLLEGLKGILVPSKPNNDSSTGNTKITAKELEEDIVKLEEEIHEQQKLAVIREAAEAPYAALLCQAASHIGVCGFRLDDYNGTTLQLTFEHPIAGVESRFTHDMAQGLWSATYLSDAFISSPELLPTSHPAAKFHEKVAMMCFADTNGLLQRVGGVDLSDAVLMLSLWLGALDAATQELVNASTERAISIDWPRLSIPVAEKSTLDILYDESVCHHFRPASAVVTQEQQQTPLDVSGTLHSLVEHAVQLSTK